jgi:hypothetical protein
MVFNRRFEFGDALLGRTKIAQVLAFSGFQFIDAGEGRAGNGLVACGLRAEFAESDRFALELITKCRDLVAQRVGLAAARRNLARRRSALEFH